ncbi:MAG: hypothetical protein EA402_07100 [Planctomycetota bacterium]|nr:MAG: hypothetical protein EA402_07100 [Planctomycetota bacterium]
MSRASRSCGIGALITLGLCLSIIPLAWLFDRASGVTGWEMAEVDSEMLAAASEAEDRQSFLDLFGFSERDPVSEQLSLIGRTGPFTQRGQMTRFVWVAPERIIDSPFGPLIVFDRSAGEELLQAQSLRNIARLTTVAMALLASLLAIGWLSLRRRRPATHRNAIDGNPAG